MKDQWLGVDVKLEAEQESITAPRSTESQYDVCLSFAGEQRSYVEKVARLLREQGARVFYDDYEQVTLWGKDLYEHLDWVYQHAARFCVLFASDDYARKVWTSHERRSAQARALQGGTEYLLPARFDDTEVPGLRPTIGYIDLRRTSEEALARLILDKLRGGSASAVAAAAPLAPRAPRTPGEQRELLAQRPPGWEYLLFAGVLLQGKITLEPKWHDVEIGYASRAGRYMDFDEAVAFLQVVLDDAQTLSGNINRVLDARAQEKAFGAPGVAGDSGRIEHLAKRLVSTYEAFIDWHANVRGVAVPSDLSRAFDLVARVAYQPASDIRRFIDQFVEEADRIPVLLGKREPVVIDLVLRLTVDERLLDQFGRELQRVERQRRRR